MSHHLPSDTLAQKHNRQIRGHIGYLKGISAENCVIRAYQEAGAELLEQRWRGRGGEIDLIFLQGQTYVFCEVKAARTLNAAIASLKTAQMARIQVAASEYLACAPKGQLSDVQFDLAAVYGQGEVKILKNAYGCF